MPKNRFLWLPACLPGLLLGACKESLITPLSRPATATLGAPVYPTGLTGLNQAGDATIQASFSDAAASGLGDATGTTASPPAGVKVVSSGNPLCDLELSRTALTGAELKLSNCVGDGEVRLSIGAGVLTNTHNRSGPASNTVAVRVDNTPPQVFSFTADASAVDSAGGANTATLTFSERVGAPSGDNSGGEFVVTGCVTPPSLAASTLVNGAGRSVTTLTLVGGDCEDGDLVSVDFDLSTVTDLAGNAGASSSHSANYGITSSAITGLATPSYDGATTAVHAGSAGLALPVTFTNVSSTTLSPATGDSLHPPAGLETTTTGPVCAISLSSTGLTDTLVTVDGCTGDGEIELRIMAGTALSTGGLPNQASGWRTVRVRNSLPEVDTWALDQPDADVTGANSLTIRFKDLVQELSPANGNGEITVSGCAGPSPSISITTVPDGAGFSEATVELSAGSCVPGDILQVELDLTKVQSSSGLSGDGSLNPAPLSYQILP